jgi:hypothetical protein
MQRVRLMNDYQFLDIDDVRQLLVGLKLALTAHMSCEQVEFADEVLASFAHRDDITPPVKFIFNQLATLADAPAEAAPKRPHLRIVRNGDDAA